MMMTEKYTKTPEWERKLESSERIHPAKKISIDVAWGAAHSHGQKRVNPMASPVFVSTTEAELVRELVRPDADRVYRALLNHGLEKHMKY